MEIELRNWRTGKIIYSAEVDTVKEAAEKAVSEKVDLSCAELSGAKLNNAKLNNARLSGKA